MADDEKVKKVEDGVTLENVSLPPETFSRPGPHLGVAYCGHCDERHWFEQMANSFTVFFKRYPTCVLICLKCGFLTRLVQPAEMRAILMRNSRGEPPPGLTFDEPLILTEEPSAKA